MKKQFFPWFNFVLLFGLGLYLTVYCLSSEVESTTGLPVIAGTLMGYALYSTNEFVKVRKSGK